MTASGHDVGDRVIVKVAETAWASLRSDDVISQVGGEALAILLPTVETVADHHTRRANPIEYRAHRHR